MPFNTTPKDWERDPSVRPNKWVFNEDEPLLRFVVDNWRKALQPCVDEIMRLDEDDDAYIEMLMEPFIHEFENSLFDGTYVAAQVLQMLSR